ARASSLTYLSSRFAVSHAVPRSRIFQGHPAWDTILSVGRTKDSGDHEASDTTKRDGTDESGPLASLCRLPWDLLPTGGIGGAAQRQEGPAAGEERGRLRSGRRPDPADELPHLPRSRQGTRRTPAGHTPEGAEGSRFRPCPPPRR